MSGCSVSTINLLHAISEEEAAPSWPTEFNPDRRNSALPAVPTAPPSNRTGTPESGVRHCPGQNQLRVAAFPPAASASPINFHPGVTQSDTEASGSRLVGMVTSPLALRRSNEAASNRLRAAHSFIKNSRESSSCATTNSTNKQRRPSSNTALSSGGGGGCVRVRVHSQSSPSPRKQPQAASEVKQRQQCLRQSSTEEDSDTNSMRSAGFGDYLKALSACPRLSDSSAPSSRGGSPLRGNPSTSNDLKITSDDLGRPRAAVITTSRRRLRSTTSECEELAAAGKRRTDFRVSQPVNNFPGSREGGQKRCLEIGPKFRFEV